ncbi:hypothetical protein EVAR_59049_1 [Eumeta japonica]|uniref:Uncharacterized protein n=1 Tax=Eumeta variegata TaxID=151549 RepID=A0A4C1YDP6_EUMVA|nr:hypothetical protein EVAR_59049_1 [Eumeta japonica]
MRKWQSMRAGGGKHKQTQPHTSPVAQLRLATRVSSPLHTAQAAHAADRRSGYPCFQQQQSRQHALVIRCLHTSSWLVFTFTTNQIQNWIDHQ